MEPEAAGEARSQALTNCLYFLERCTPEDREAISRALVTLYERRPCAPSPSASWDGCSPHARCEHIDNATNRRCVNEAGHKAPHLMARGL